MDTRQAGEELSQLSRFLFDSAANKWYTAIGLEILGGLIATVFGIFHISDMLTFAGGLISATLLVMAYILRVRFSDQYETAETMRRQSAFSEALDWPINKIQMSEWKLRAGKKLRGMLRKKPRERDYYAAQTEFGPEKLTEMTIESAFYTRNSYIRLRSWIWNIFTIATLVVLVIVLVALTSAIPKSISMMFAQAITLIVPTALAIDLLGWGIKLGGLITGIKEVELDLDRIRGTVEMDLPQIMRLVAEYNCLVIVGIPIHKWMFNKWHDEIRELWMGRNK